MPDYLPLCTFRQDLLPSSCGSCAWWFTCGRSPSEEHAPEVRREWMRGLEPTWGSTGLILPKGRPSAASTTSPPSTSPAASVHYAPVPTLPRLRDLPLGPLPMEAALVFCLRVDNGGDHALARRILQKSLIQLRSRGIAEVYAYASLEGGVSQGDRCEFFAPEFLAACGFRPVRDNGELFLMSADLRGLAAVLGRVETVLRKVLGSDPTPSPATWTRPGT